MESRTKQQTRKKIQNVFVELLTENRIDRIKVSDITKTAHINRSTFYEYYQDVNSLLTDIEDELLSEFRKQLEMVYQDFKLEHSAEIFGKALALLNVYGDTFFGLLGPNGDHGFSMRFVENVKPLILAAFGIQEFTPKLEILITFEMSGIVGVYTKWCAEGRKQPLEDVVKLIQELLYAGMTTDNNKPNIL